MGLNAILNSLNLIQFNAMSGGNFIHFNTRKEIISQNQKKYILINHCSINDRIYINTTILHYIIHSKMNFTEYFT